MKMVRFRRGRIVDNVNAVRLDFWHLFRVMVCPIVIGNFADAKVFQYLSSICRVTDVFVGCGRVTSSVLQEEFFAAWVIFLVVGYIVDVIPNNDPQVGFSGMLRYLFEAVDTVGHAVKSC
jgi:hypothetical protein